MEDDHHGFLEDVEVTLIDKTQADYTDIVLIGFRRPSFRTSFSDNPSSLYTIFIVIRIGSRTLARSEVEFFLITVNDFKTLVFVIKNSISDLAGILDPPLFNIIIL